MRTAHRTLAAVAALLAASLAGLAGASAVAADSGDAVFTVEQAEPAGGTALHYVVRVTYSDDGHPVRDATLTANALAADGTPSTPVPLTAIDQDGRYEATVEFPAAGDWTVRFTSVTPPGTLEQAQAITAPTTTTVATTTTEASEATEAPADDDDSAEAAAADESSASDDGVTPWVPIAVGTVAALAVGGGAIAVRRRAS